MRLTLYFIFGGLGGGSIVAAYLLAQAGGISKGDLIFPDLTGGAILALGLAWVWIPAQPRLRSLNHLIRPTPSWVSFETYAALAFFLALAIIAKVSTPAVELLVALSAATFLICQAQVAHASKSRPAWRAPEIPSLIVITALASGVGLLALLCAIVPAIIRAATLAPVAGLVLAAMGAYRWREYTRGADASLRDDLTRVSPTIYIAAHAVPAALYLAALMPWPGKVYVLPIAGVAAVIGGAIWTQTLVARLGTRDFTTSPVGL